MFFIPTPYSLSSAFIRGLDAHRIIILRYIQAVSAVVALAEFPS